MNVSPPAHVIPLLLKIPEACKLSGIRETKLREYVKSGRLELVKIGSASRIPRESLELLISSIRRAHRPTLENSAAPAAA